MDTWKCPGCGHNKLEVFYDMADTITTFTVERKGEEVHIHRDYGVPVRVIAGGPPSEFHCPGCGTKFTRKEVCERILDEKA